MTGSVEDVRAGLALVVEHLGTAGRHAASAGHLIDDAVAGLTHLSEQHPESLVPTELRKAVDELQRSVSLIEGGSLAVTDIEARL